MAAVNGSDLPSGLSGPARCALAATGITTLSDPTTRTGRDVAALHGVGPTAMVKLRAALAERNWSFAS